MADRTTRTAHTGQPSPLAGVSATPQFEPQHLDPAGALHLGEVALHLRQRLRIDASLSDGALFESLALIVTESNRRERWKIAFLSPLGTWLAHHGRDLNTALNIVIGSLPEARS